MCLIFPNKVLFVLAWIKLPLMIKIGMSGINRIEKLVSLDGINANDCVYMLWFNFILGSNFISYVSNSLSSNYHNQNKGNKILTKDKIEPQHIYL